MRARFGGQCPACGNPITEGVEIEITPDGWAHSSCVTRDHQSADSTFGLLCPACHLHHRGLCLP